MDDREKIEFIESYIKVGNGDYKWDGNHVELIRCKDCIYKDKCEISGGFDGLHPDWYCADGKRQEKAVKWE